jgi:hypothetical protein
MCFDNVNMKIIVHIMQMQLQVLLLIFLIRISAIKLRF